jgi:short-subunit dehydrogenase
MRATDGRKTILITGASSGLGAALARALAPAGHRIALVARREAELNEVARQVQDRSGISLALAENLTDPDAPARVVENTVARFGGLDVLVNNAGIGLPRYFSECDPAGLREQVNLNFVAPILVTRWAIPHLARSHGTVVNIGSAITAVANPMLGVYGATKAALAYWNDALRRELRPHGISVSLVDLGPVASDFFTAVIRRARSDGEPRPLGINPAPDGLYNAMRDRPPDLISMTADRAASRIVRLIEHPRRRLSLPRRVVWPFRLFAGCLVAFPELTDAAVAAMISRVEREEARFSCVDERAC